MATDTNTAEELERKALALEEYASSMPEGVATEAFTEAAELRRKAWTLRSADAKANEARQSGILERAEARLNRFPSDDLRQSALEALMDAERELDVVLEGLARQRMRADEAEHDREQWHAAANAEQERGAAAQAALRKLLVAADEAQAALGTPDKSVAA